MTSSDPPEPAPAPRRAGALGRLARQSGIYTLGNAAVKASGLLLAVIHWNPAYLAVADYGRLGAFQAAGALLVPLLGLSLSSGLLTFVADERLEGDRPAVPFTALVTAAAVATLGAALLALAAPWLAPRVFATPEATLATRLIALYAAAKAIGAVPLVYLQARERPALYSLAVVGEFALLIAGNLVFVVAWGWGLRGALWALALSACAGTAVLAGGMLRAVAWRFQPALVRRLLRFGAPLVLAGLALPFLHVGDRFLIGWLDSADRLAVYEAAARIAGVLNVVVVQGFQTAFAAAGLRALGAGEGAALHRRVFRHYAAAAGAVVLGVALFAYDGLRLVAESPVYLDAAPLIFPLALGFLFYGLYAVGVNPLYAHGKTRQVALAVAGAALLNAALNVALIPPFGIAGAAVATLAAYAALAVATARLAQRLEAVRFPWGALAVVVAVATALWVASLGTTGWPAPARLAARAGLLALYAPLVVAARVYTPEEVRALAARLRR